MKRTRIDPGRAKVHGHRLDPKAVEFYEKNPGGRYRGGGRAVAQMKTDGSVVVLNGAHRRQAAINKGRPLEVDLYAPGEKLPRYES